MIRAHLATFPPRREILVETLESLSSQVDAVFVCLNEYTAIPDELSRFSNVHAFIPDSDLKDAGKFAPEVQPNDTVFTCDDDILYPPTYVQDTIENLETLGAKDTIVGYQGNTWKYKKQKAKYGWQSHLFKNALKKMTLVDILGTGTACMMGASYPSLSDVRSAAGFIDYRFSRIQTSLEREMWALPREEGYLVLNLPENLKPSSLFETINRNPSINTQKEIQLLMREGPLRPKTSSQ